MKKYTSVDLNITIAVVMVVFLLYLVSAPHTVVLEDDGLFLMAAWFNGIAHPPGYPLYTWLSHIVTWIPVGPVAYRVHLLTAIFAALGCGVLYLIIRKLLGMRFPACVAAIGFGISPVYWSQAIIAEVYSLNLLILLILLFLCFSYVEQDDNTSCKTMAWIGLFAGAGIANHWPLILISAPMLIIVLQQKGTRPLKQAGYFLPFFVIGLLPYVWLILRSQANPEISFYGPLNSISDIWFFISREGFRQVDQSLSAGFADKLQFIWFTLTQSAHQFGIAGAILITTGLFYQRQVITRRIVFALWVGFLSHTLGLILLLDFDYDYLHQNIFRVYPIIAYSILAVWLATGLCWFARKLEHTEFSKPGRDKLKIITCLVVLGSTASSSIPENIRGDETAIEHYAKLVLDSLSPESILFLDDDFTVAPVGYINKVDKYRDDVEIYQSSGLIFSNRLFRGDNKTSPEEKDYMVNRFISQSDRDIYYDNLPEHDYAVSEYGLFSKVDRTGGRGEYRFVFDEKISDYYLQVLGREGISDPWTRMLYRYQERDFCYLLSGLSAYTLNAGKKRLFLTLIDEHCTGYYGVLGQIKRLLLEDPINLNRAKHLVEIALPLNYQAMTKQDQAAIFNFQGLIFMLSGDTGIAMESLANSIDIWRHPDNDAYRILQSSR